MEEVNGNELVNLESLDTGSDVQNIRISGDNVQGNDGGDDTLRIQSTLIGVNRIEGVTRALIIPTASGPDQGGWTSSVISGLGAVANLSGDANSVDKRAASSRRRILSELAWSDATLVVRIATGVRSSWAAAARKRL